MEFLIYMDNAPSHTKLPWFDNLQYCFFRPSTTGYHQPLDNVVFSLLKKRLRAFLDDHILKHDSLDIKEEELVYRMLDIYNSLSEAVFKRAWLNTLLKEEEFEEKVENVEVDEELTIAEDLLDKEDEEDLIQRFTELNMEEDVQEVPLAIAPSKSPPKKQCLITAFFK